MIPIERTSIDRETGSTGTVSDLVGLGQGPASKTFARHNIFLGDKLQLSSKQSIPFNHPFCHYYLTTSPATVVQRSFSVLLALHLWLQVQPQRSSSLAGKMFMLRNGKSLLNLGSCIPTFPCPMIALVSFGKLFLFPKARGGLEIVISVSQIKESPLITPDVEHFRICHSYKLKLCSFRHR